MFLFIILLKLNCPYTQFRDVTLSLESSPVFGRQDKTRQDKIFILINHNRTMVQRKTSFKYIWHIIHSTHDKRRRSLWNMYMIIIFTHHELWSLGLSFLQHHQMTADLQFFLIYPNLHAPPSRLKRQWNLNRLEEQGVRERGWMGLGHGEIKSEREIKNTDLNKKERERERVCVNLKTDQRKMEFILLTLKNN